MHWPWYKPILSLIPLLWGVQMVGEIALAHRLRRVGVEVTGQVVSQRRIRADKRIYRAPLLRFTTRAGQVLQAESAGHAIGLYFKDREAVRLRYDPDRPARLLLVPELGNGSRYVRLDIAGLLLAVLWLWG